MTPNTKLYLRQFTLGMAGFVVLLIIGLIARAFIYQSYLQNIVLMLPIFPGIYAGLSLARGVRSLDEMQQRIQLEAFSFSLANTAFVALLLGLLQASSPEYFNMAWMIPIMAGFWGLGLWIAQRRYQ